MPRVGELVIASAKENFYQERSLKSAAEQAGAWLPSREPLQRFLQYVESGGYVDQKNLDALELIETLARLEELPAGEQRMQRRESQTALIQTLLSEVICAPLEGAHEGLPAEEQIAVKARSLGPTYRLLCGLAQLLSLGDAVARARQFVPSRETVERVFDENDFGLGARAKEPGWAKGHDLDEFEFTRFVHRLARINGLLNGEAGRNGARPSWQKYFLALLRIHGEYEGCGNGRRERGSRRVSDVLGTFEQQDGEKFRLFRRMARLWEVVDRAAQARGLGADGMPDELQDFADDFREERGLESRRATYAWLRRNDLDTAGFDELIALWVRLQLLINNAQVDTLGVTEVAADVCWFHDALRLTGYYVRLKQEYGSRGKLE